MTHAYRGALGRTRTTTVHVTDHSGALVSVQVHTSIDAATDPELVERMLSDTLNVLELGGTATRIAVPVIYHDPYAEHMVLVLQDAHRHREIDERIAVLQQLRDAAAPIPSYAKDFAVVFGAAGLRAWLEQRRGDRAGDTESFDAVTYIEPEISVESEIEAEIDLAPSTDVLTTEVTELPLDDTPLDTSLGSRCYSNATGVHAVAVVGDAIARGLTGALDVRLVLHRTASYPVIALVIGPPEAMRSPAATDLAILVLDIADARDRGVLQELARSFELTIDLVSHARRFRRVELTAPLAENAAYILHAAADHLRGIALDDEPDFERARSLVLGAGFDLLGAEHPERSEFNDDNLAQPATAQQLRRALAIARRFTRPVPQDYLICIRSFPLPHWHQLRRDVLARAVEWGLWMGAELAQIAVAEGLSRSRRELVAQLARSFEALRRNTAAFDLDPEAAADNAAAIAEEARTLGLELAVRSDAGAIASDAAVAVSGSIGATPARPQPQPGSWSNEELLALLDEGGRPENRLPRVVAALALCHRADPRNADPVIAAAMTMNRSEAVRVLAMAVKFGAAARPALLDGLASTKAYLRHGCALALALLRTDEATRAVIELLLSEPTELWREIARAIGHIGTAALGPLADRYQHPGEHAGTAEARIVWAMAHIGVRGGKQAVAAMAEQPSIVAPIAAKALTLLALAASDQVDARRGATPPRSERDLSVNQAFSRQFFEALEQDRADASEMRYTSTVVEP
jgi:hypothetical protein